MTILTNFYNSDHFYNFFTILTILSFFLQFWQLLLPFWQLKRQWTMDLWHLRHWLQFWQLRTWIHDNLCCLTIKSDIGQHSQFLRCFFDKIHLIWWGPGWCCPMPIALVSTLLSNSFLSDGQAVEVRWGLSFSHSVIILQSLLCNLLVAVPAMHFANVAQQ